MLEGNNWWWRRFIPPYLGIDVLETKSWSLRGGQPRGPGNTHSIRVGLVPAEGTSGIAWGHTSFTLYYGEGVHLTIWMEGCEEACHCKRVVKVVEDEDGKCQVIVAYDCPLPILRMGRYWADEMSATAAPEVRRV